ncbi:MAG: hypothetical protein ACYDC6_15400 [Acidobacteriaceae bacterium]
MADAPASPPTSEQRYAPGSMEIPRPQAFPPANIGVDDLALRESEGFAKDSRWALRHASWDWLLRFVLKIALFGFVIALNVWWDINVSRMLWESGHIGGPFHLNDPVLIALVTTSMANFVALIAIVAKHLFPAK